MVLAALYRIAKANFEMSMPQIDDQNYALKTAFAQGRNTVIEKLGKLNKE